MQSDEDALRADLRLTELLAVTMALYYINHITLYRNTYVYIYIYIYTHNVYVYIYTYIYIYIYIYFYIYIYIYIHINYIINYTLYNEWSSWPWRGRSPRPCRLI